MNYGITIQNKTLVQQMAAVRRTYPGFTTSLDQHKLIIKGDLQPTARSVAYSTKIVYHYCKRPEITILEPALVKNFRGEDIPHVYPGNKLCLYQPKYYEFTFNHFISETIIPWTSLWLYYYEDWHITGDWNGGGEHANNKN